MTHSVPVPRPTAVNLAEKLAQFSEHWAPRIIAGLNDYHVKLAKVEGEFVWHSHPETDELFLVLSGILRIDFRNHSLTLNPGELTVIPRGVEHRPIADSECHILLIEPSGTLNTGDAKSPAGPSSTGEWI